MKLAFLTGYNGRNFAGSQFQPDKRTVEGEFIKAGQEFGLWSGAEDAHFRTAGRTDKGVSARRQLITVTTEKPNLAIEALNFHLPDDIWCLGAARVSDEFYARFAVSERVYRYYFPYPADIAKMHDAAQLFLGEHNFSGFSRMEAGRDPVRTVLSAKVFASPRSMPVFEVSAKSFLWNMVRGMAGLLQVIGLGLAEPQVIEKQLTAPEYRVHPAPAEGLVYWDSITDIDFAPMRQKRETNRALAREVHAFRTGLFASEALLEDESGPYHLAQVKRDYASYLQK
ncbi:MAG TPA: tRNA pseudouridine(38-40) synthase TruA [Methanocorpusculum sp.]|nr:tRNA pseudouridine(38-40) synthase TruA [Methanocorpusculum sp.]